MRKTQNPRNILYLVLSIVIAAGIWYYVDEFNGRVVTMNGDNCVIEMDASEPPILDGSQ